MSDAQNTANTIAADYGAELARRTRTEGEDAIFSEVCSRTLMLKAIFDTMGADCDAFNNDLCELACYSAFSASNKLAKRLA